MPTPRAGQHARETTRRLALRALVYLGTLVTTGAIGALVLGWRSPEFVLLELALIGAIVAIDRIALPVIDRWDQGASGEQAAGELLEKLADKDWLVLHDVDTGRGNIDHVLIGPGGLFTVETKSHGGRISVGRVDAGMLRQAYAQRKWLERITGERVDALLVFSRAYLDQPVSRQRGVLVLPARMLCEHLRRRGSWMAPEQVTALYARLSAALA